MNYLDSSIKEAVSRNLPYRLTRNKKMLTLEVNQSSRNFTQQGNPNHLKTVFESKHNLIRQKKHDLLINQQGSILLDKQGCQKTIPWAEAKNFCFFNNGTAYSLNGSVKVRDKGYRDYHLTDQPISHLKTYEGKILFAYNNVFNVFDPEEMTLHSFNEEETINKIVLTQNPSKAIAVLAGKNVVSYSLLAENEDAALGKEIVRTLEHSYPDPVEDFYCSNAMTLAFTKQGSFQNHSKIPSHFPRNTILFRGMPLFQHFGVIMYDGTFVKCEEKILNFFTDGLCFAAQTKKEVVYLYEPDGENVKKKIVILPECYAGIRINDRTIQVIDLNLKIQTCSEKLT